MFVIKQGGKSYYNSNRKNDKKYIVMFNVWSHPYRFFHSNDDESHQETI